MSSEIVTREQLIEAYKPIVDSGIRDPHDITDKSVSRLDTSYHEAQAQLQKTLTTEDRLKAAVAEATVLVDAGFTDHDLLEEIARGWLVDLLTEADELGDQELVAEIKAKILEVEKKIQEQDPTFVLTEWDD